MTKILTSVVHGYSNLHVNTPGAKRPALWIVSNNERVLQSYTFPRNPKEFELLGDLLIGEKPFPNAPDFETLPRFGFTGLSDTKDHIYAGAWNAVYKINKHDYGLEAIITNHLMNDPHGIWANEDMLITILTSKDSVVFTDHCGQVIDHFTIHRNLRVVKDDSLDHIDWRFISKQFRGSTGYWHFNNIQKFDNEIWLTSRNANSFVVVDLEQRTASLRLMNFDTPVLLHDGIKRRQRFYFTSIDGKIIIAEDHKTTELKQHNRETLGKPDLYNQDLITKTIRLKDTEYGSDPNWCRGIEVRDGIIYVSIDGRYGTDLSFGLLGLGEEDYKMLFHYRLRWSEVGDEKDLKYVTGFAVLSI